MKDNHCCERRASARRERQWFVYAGLNAWEISLRWLDVSRECKNARKLLKPTNVSAACGRSVLSQMKAAAELAQAILAQEEEEEQNEEERECGHEHKRGADGAACARDAGECARQRDDEQPEKGKKIFALSAKIAEEKRCGEHDAAAEQHGCGDAGPARIEQVDEDEEDAQEDDGFDGLADAVVFQQIRRNDHGVEGEKANDDDEEPGRSAAGEINDDAKDDAGDEDPVENVGEMLAAALLFCDRWIEGVILHKAGSFPAKTGCRRRGAARRGCPRMWCRWLFW